MGDQRGSGPGRLIEDAELAADSPLERFGMRAGVADLDHGAFRAAASVAPVDMIDSAWLRVADDEPPARPGSMPRLLAGESYRTVEARSGDRVDLRADVLMPSGSPGGPGPSAVGPLALGPANRPGLDAALPVVVFVPGGGFVQSPRSSALRRRAVVAAAGFVVVSIEYRTLRQGTALDGADDVAAAVTWVRRHAARFGGDPSRVGLWGESAGGFLAALAVTSRRIEGVACVVDVFGLTDLSQVAMDFDAGERARHHTPEITEAQYVLGRDSGLTIDDDPAAIQRANPVAHVTGAEPPFLLLHGERDGLVSPGQTLLLHRELLRHGVSSRRLVVAGAGHFGPEWSTDTVMSTVVEHLRSHLAPVV